MEPVEHARLSRQCQQMLTRLEQGPVSNTELSTIALKYTGRISDLRAAGYDVENYDRDHATGVSWYRLRRPATVEIVTIHATGPVAISAALAQFGRLF